MGSKPLNLHKFVYKYNSDDKPEFISHDIEYHPVVTNQAYIREIFLQFIKIMIPGFRHFLIPDQQRQFSSRKFFTILKYGPAINDIKHSPFAM